MTTLNTPPTFEQWMNAGSDWLCDVTVNLKRNEGQQEIKNCIIYFNMDGDIRITKKGYLITDFFFVESISSTYNYRLEI